MISLGKLNNVELRTVFVSEADDFTPWLAEENNLKLLGDTIGLELQLEATEKDVGPFRADILCRDTESENWVLIENQIERTDHTHLGQLLTYAAGLEAVTIVWIARRFTDEHRTALDWLNNKTGDGINFFGLEIELWRIGDSIAAPKFNVVSRPNEWEKAVKTNTGSVSDYKTKQLRFWTGFKDFVPTNGPVRCGNPAAQHYMHFSVGLSGAYFAASMSRWHLLTGVEEPEQRVQLVFTGSKAKQRFASLEARKQQIENALGLELIWYNPADTQKARIFARHDANFDDEQQWPEQYKWLLAKLEVFQKVFTPLLLEIEEPQVKAEAAYA